MRTFFLPAFLASLSLGTLLTPVQAADFTWQGLGNSYNWSDAHGNWDAGLSYPYPGYIFTNDTASFGISQADIVIVDSTFTVSTLTFSASGYSLFIPATLIVKSGIGATYVTAPNLDVGNHLGIGGTSTIRNLTSSNTAIISTLGSPSILNVVGPSSTFSGGILGPVSLTVGDGTHAASLTLNRFADSPSTYTGTTLVQANATLATGTANALSANSDHVIDGTLSLSGGSATVNSLSGSGSVDLAARTLTINSGGTTFGGSISGAGGTLVKAGTGTLTLTGANTYTGTTTITGGRLNVNNSIAGGALVQTGGTLGGTGSIGGAVTVQSGGTLSPGTSPGQLTLLSGLTLESGSTLEMEFDGTTTGLFDQIDVQGLFAAGGTLQLTIDEGYTPALGDSFTLFNGTTPGFNSGSFLLSTNLPEGLAWDTSALGSLGVVTVVPEPSTWALLLLGGAALGYSYRRPRLGK